MFTAVYAKRHLKSVQASGKFKLRELYSETSFEPALEIFMKAFESRLIFLLSFLLLWCFLTVGALFYYTFWAREAYLEMGQRMALRYGDFVAPRGRIFDRDGVLLAWTEKYFDLYLSEPENGEIAHEVVIQAVRAVITDCEIKKVTEKSWLLKAALTPRELIALEPVMRRFPGLLIQNRLERKTLRHPEISRLVGMTTIENGAVTGTSGAEYHFNDVLTGTAGTYEVMLDRHRRWINGSWRLIKPAVPGEDVTMPFALADLLEEQKNEE